MTWRLADALPADVVEQMKADADRMPEGERQKEYARRIEAYCDAGHGSCHLNSASCARAVQETLFFDHRRRFDLHAWCVMPNHVHVLFTPIQGFPLGRIVASLKAASASKVNKLISSSGTLWQRDYFDRAIRDGEHLERVREYIEWNPVKAKLVQDPVLYPWSSASEDARARLETVAN